MSKFPIRDVDDSWEIDRRAAVHSFRWFAVIASLNHALCYVITSMATSLLGPTLGGVTVGLNWSLNAVSGLFVASTAVEVLGFKTAMIISLWGYALFIITFYISIIYPSISWPVAILGSVVSGFTSAIWWTAQGVYFESVCEGGCGKAQILDGDKDDVFESKKYVDMRMNILRSDLSAEWTLIYQGADVIVFLLISVFPVCTEVTIVDCVEVLCILGIVTSMLGHTFDDIKEKTCEFGIATSGEFIESVLAVPMQFVTDARAALLAPFVFGFGITTAMFCYYVNFDVIASSSSLGIVSIGFFESFSYLIAILAAYPYAYIANHFEDGRHYVMQFGSLSFCLSGAIVYFLSTTTLSIWWVMLVCKLFYGLGRGVFEGSCRAVYAEMFTGRDLSLAFAAQTLLAGASGGTCFFMYGLLDKNSIGLITVMNGIVAIACYKILLGFDYTLPMKWENLARSFCTSEQDIYRRAIRGSSRIVHSNSFSGLPTYSLLQIDPDQNQPFSLDLNVSGC